MTNYRIYMVDGEILNVPNDVPIDLEEIAKARWMEVNIPLPVSGTKKAYLNIAHIIRIEIIGE